VNNEELFVLIAIACIFIAIVLSLAIAVIVSNNMYRKRLERMSYYQINTSANIDSSIPELLDLIVTESFSDYQITHLLPEIGYINSEQEELIRKDLAEMVMNRISGAALDKISLLYRREYIGDILGDKIYITVMNFVINNNKNFKN
jgi:hypothetical protein